jgi:hypothetical protein
MTKPNCHKCQWRRPLPGNAHIRCGHPAADSEAKRGTLADLIGIVGGAPPIAHNKLGVTGHPAGITRGWFSWPYNFDPTWLLTCTGFTERDG